MSTGLNKPDYMEREGGRNFPVLTFSSSHGEDGGVIHITPAVPEVHWFGHRQSASGDYIMKRSRDHFEHRHPSTVHISIKNDTVRFPAARLPNIPAKQPRHIAE